MPTPVIVTRIGKGAPLSFAEVDANFTNLRDAVSGVDFALVNGDLTIDPVTGLASIGTGVIVNADINAAAQISHSKLEAMTSGSVLLGSSGNVPTATAISGALTLDAAGVATLGSGVISDSQVASDAAIAGTKVSPDFGDQAIATTAAISAGGIDLVSGIYKEAIHVVDVYDIDCSAGNYFTKTIDADSTFTVSAVPSGCAYAFTLELTHTSGNVTWFSGVQWPGDLAPTLQAGKTHVLVFLTDDAGTTWRAAALTGYTSA